MRRWQEEALLSSNATEGILSGKMVRGLGSPSQPRVWPSNEKTKETQDNTVAWKHFQKKNKANQPALSLQKMLAQNVKFSTLVTRSV